jgi:RNA polymerase sigma-70 factor (ECF subfamily)
MMTRAAPAPDAPADDFGARLEAVFQAAQGELLGTLYYLVGNLEDARDAVQETFLKCWRNPPITEIVDLKAWVFRVALNTGRDLRRTAWHRRKQPLAEDSAMLATATGPDVGLLQEEQLDSLRRALLRLRPEEQEVFLLRQNGGLSYEQIAAATSLPLGTMKTRMRAAIQQLRTAVGTDSASPLCAFGPKGA